MKLTMHTDYALRTLIYIGVRDDRLVTIQEIADAYGISRNHLMKVAHMLSLGGFVTSTRGNGGGIKLAKPASKINIGEVVRYTEKDLGLVGCFESSHDCRIAPACLLRSTLRKALKAFFDVLDQHSLQDLLVAKPLLEDLLGITAQA